MMDLLNIDNLLKASAFKIFKHLYNYINIILGLLKFTKNYLLD